MIALTNALQLHLKLLLDFKADCVARRCDQRTSGRNLPSLVRLCLHETPESASTDGECLTSILENIGHHLQTSYRCSRIVRSGTPMLTDVGTFLGHDKSECNMLRCSYGLGLLLESYKSYLSPLGSACALSDSRLKVLRFAQEAMSSISAVLDDSTMPCRCQDTLAYHLQDFHSDLQAYLQTRGFDLYFQSPWVSGSHLHEILHALSYYGLRLLSYRNYFGAIVHVYNAMRQHTQCEPIPILENIINTFGHLLFPGGRPNRNFRNSYIRYMGGRLRLSHNRLRSGCHSLAIPSHRAKATAGFGAGEDCRSAHQKTSFSCRIRSNGYHLHRAEWDEVGKIDWRKDGSSPLKPRKCLHGGVPGYDLASCDTRYRLQHLEQAISVDFEGDFPIAKINFCQIYLAIVRVVSLISDEFHGEKARAGSRCLCFADEVLSAADRYRDSQDDGIPFEYRKEVRICQNAIIEGLGPMNVEEALWKGV